MNLNQNALAGSGKYIDLLNTINGGVTMTTVEVGQNEEGVFVHLQNPSLGGENYHVELKPTHLTVFTTLEPADEFQDQEEENKVVVPTFIRNFPVPGNVDEDKIEATFENGVLTIFAPFKPGISGSSKIIDIRLN